MRTRHQGQRNGAECVIACGWSKHCYLQRANKTPPWAPPHMSSPPRAPPSKKPRTDLHHGKMHPLTLSPTSELCEHLLSGLSRGAVRAPRSSEAVHKEECTLCFDTVDVSSPSPASKAGEPSGVDVCLTCFNGSCPRLHSHLHSAKTGHALVARVRRWLRPPTEEEKASAAQLPQKLALPASNEEDRYDWSFTPACLVCEKAFTLDLAFLPELAEVLSGVRTHYASARQNEIQGWEEEIVPCTHTEKLVQAAPEDRQMMPLALPGEEAEERTCSQCKLVCFGPRDPIPEPHL